MTFAATIQYIMCQLQQCPPQPQPVIYASHIFLLGHIDANGNKPSILQLAVNIKLSRLNDIDG